MSSPPSTLPEFLDRAVQAARSQQLVAVHWRGRKKYRCVRVGTIVAVKESFVFMTSETGGEHAIPLFEIVMIEDLP